MTPLADSACERAYVAGVISQACLPVLLLLSPRVPTDARSRGPCAWHPVIQPPGHTRSFGPTALSHAAGGHGSGQPGRRWRLAVFPPRIKHGSNARARSEVCDKETPQLPPPSNLAALAPPTRSFAVCVTRTSGSVPPLASSPRNRLEFASRASPLTRGLAPLG